MQSAKRALSDSVAVALGALDHPASHVTRKFASDFATKDGCVIWGTSLRANPDLAAFVNGSLLRCFDYNDFYVGERNSGHPSDMAAGVITAAEWIGASGKDALVALAVGYEVVGAVFDAFSTAPGGWDYTNLTAIGACAAFARLLGLSEEQAREAFGITVTNRAGALQTKIKPPVPNHLTTDRSGTDDAMHCRSRSLLSSRVFCPQ